MAGGEVVNLYRKEMQGKMAISVAVPKDLSGIKTKVALNLTKRQIICFSGAALVGVPLYFLTKGELSGRRRQRLSWSR